MASGSEQLCSFTAGGLSLAVDVRRVQEVLRPQQMTRVPGAPPAIRGLINLRGQIVTAVDLRSRLGIPPLEGDAEPSNVVLRSEEGAVSLLVDAIGDVLETDGAYEPPPSHLPVWFRGLLRGVLHLERRLLLVLDPDALLTEGLAAGSGLADL